MFGNILKSFSKLLGGTSAEKALKEIEPIVAQINEFYTEYQSLSNDELRGKTQEFVQRINAHLSEIDAEIADLKKQLAEAAETDIELRDDIFNALLPSIVVSVDEICTRGAVLWPQHSTMSVLAVAAVPGRFDP